MLYPVTNNPYLPKIQEIKNAIFLASLGKDFDTPYYVFYQENPDVEAGHSHLFAMRQDRFNQWYILKGDDLFDVHYAAASDGKDTYISNYRHAFIDTPWGFIDGGSSYMRTAIVEPPKDVKVGMLKLDWIKMLSFIQENDKVNDFETRYEGLSTEGWDWK